MTQFVCVHTQKIFHSSGEEVMVIFLLYFKKYRSRRSSKLSRNSQVSTLPFYSTVHQAHSWPAIQAQKETSMILILADMATYNTPILQ